MSKKFKSQASSSRAAASAFGSFGSFSGGLSSEGKEPSALTYIAAPPDLSRIAEQQLVIAFKNLLKKDDITRLKALEELRDHISTVEEKKGTLDDGFLDAWFRIYPRLSIDLSRRVRQVAHPIQGTISGLVGKRILPNLPKIIGAWIAGIYDNDRLVHRAALESFTKVFTTEDKRNNVWRIYQGSILDFVDDVILHQTALTLSDERTVKRDDAEGKYSRVAGAAILLFNRVLGNSSDEDLRKNLSEIENLLASKNLWALCYHDDPYVRRSIYILLRSAVSREPGWIDWKTLSSAVIGKSLSLQQIGSATELSESLLLLSSLRPQIWTDDYTGKSSSSKRLRQYMQKGSQGGHSNFWSNLDQLLRITPQEVLAGADKATADHGITCTSAIALTEALQEGLNSREEPRSNLAIGWKSYIQIGTWLSTLVPQEQKSDFIAKRLSPLVVQYVKIDPKLTQWSLPAELAEGICVDCVLALASTKQTQELQLLCTCLSDGLLEAVKLSSPEQSKDFRESQDSVCAQSKRLLDLESAVLSRVADTEVEPQVLEVFDRTSTSLLEGCLDVLRNRNGKPYGAAATVVECVCSLPHVARKSQDLQNFVQNDVPELLLSPSADRLISIILKCREWDGFASSFENVVERALALEPEQSNVHVLQGLLFSLDFNYAEHKEKLNSLIVRALGKACKGSHAHWPIITAVLQNKTSQDELRDQIFLYLIESLSSDDKVFDVLHGLSHIGKSAPSSVREFQNGTLGSKLAGKLLFLTESPTEEVARLAEALLKSFKESGVGDTSAKSGIEILQHGFSHVDEESLSIESLLAIAEELLPGLTAEGATGTVKDLLPSRRSWEESLTPFLQLPPRSSTAITSPLGGAVHLVQRELSDSFKALWPTIPRDSDHRSSAFRLAIFTVSVLSTSEILKYLDQGDLETLFHFLPLAIQLIDDDLSIENCNGISGLELADQREEYMEIVFAGRKVVGNWIRDNEPVSFAPEKTVSSSFAEFWESRLEDLKGTSPLDYRVGEAFVKIMSVADSLQKSKSSEDVAKICREARTANVIRSASWFAVLRSSILSNPIGNRICNELIADSTGLKPQDPSQIGLRKLALLNILLSGEEEVVSTIPTQRLVFLTKNLIECLQSDSMSLGLKSEVIQTLSLVLPALGEIYGSHWEESMGVLSSVLQGTNGGEEALPLLVSSFRLFARLKSISESDSNDDVQDAWSDRKAGLFNALASTIDTFDSSTTFHQPRDVAVDLLRRLMNTIPVDNLEDVSETFHLLTAHSRAVQRTAYTILHHYIPHAQEKVSFEVALSKTAVSLPDELVSLLLEPPTMQMVSAAYGDDKMWTSVRAYLLSWKVVFDHFANASLPVQEYYMSSIRENNILTPLLEFTFDFLQKSHGKMIDASKLEIRSFEPDESESAEKETQWLLVHLYYLCMRYSANMTKNWWIDTKKRIKGPVEAWSERYISPLVVEDALKSVTDWIATQDANEERALEVKISPKTGEIIASIPVDEESPPVAISITLPPAYPLQPALVVGRSRVLVDEKKWKSWLLTIQGVIMFANGNLVDGLLAFRRNVQGALKGQSECAICYSVISTDMQTPNKRCATCKNTFHSVCLFRWFKSSNQSTCPLCRNNFVYV
ncbi:RING zinc finger protein, putative [Penicillium digitatum]|uniref:E3 ubiquitin-protein ligase listerin n=3 Tax=Penicillium digitatum TaxID=36651 RepID=K9G5F4_PEND2|nr:RING zinc finger protein, putative [Penicillium digitatum Pd1]EKV08568.1 RING zinc finger protein, putative [Penicillium digitatum Pd1]EKV10078.1 RING zinc finger protein, putative [Penicillium digitatum PHI26]QQK41863.1 RING zinc finger protein, putative [Penicillium digitatum]